MKRPKSIETKPDRVMTQDDILKYEIAEELGLMDKIRKNGWKGLTGKESGRIGGIMKKRKHDRAAGISGGSGSSGGSTSTGSDTGTSM